MEYTIFIGIYFFVGGYIDIKLHVEMYRCNRWTVSICSESTRALTEAWLVLLETPVFNFSC